MVEFDPELIKTSKMPVFYKENGVTRAYINADIYRGLSPEEKDAYKKALFERLDLNPSPKEKAEMNNFFDQADKYLVPNAFDPDKKFVIIESGQFHFEGPDINHDQTFNLVANHERMHAHYGLKEAGSEYAATVETLLQKPESRETLQNLADNNLMRRTWELEKNNSVSGPYRHGPETAQAMNAALRISPQELEKLKAMPQEERMKKIIEDAKKYDQLSDRHDGMDPAENPNQKVRDLLHKTFPELENPDADIDEKIINARMQELGRNNPFDKTSEEYRLLNDIVAANERASQRPKILPEAPKGASTSEPVKQQPGMQGNNLLASETNAWTQFNRNLPPTGLLSKTFDSASTFLMAPSPVLAMGQTADFNTVPLQTGNYSAPVTQIVKPV